MPVEPRDVARTGADLLLSGTGHWLTPRDVTAPLVVLIHGFTSHGRYLQELARFIDGHGLCAATFNYDSYLGIDRGADDLVARLIPVAEPLRGHGLAFVGHSMGGLVARLAARRLAVPLRDALRGVVCLGTPHRGALADHRWLDFMLDWAEALADPNPFARSPLCRAARQLTRQDPEALIDDLNGADSTSPLPHPMLSISGGQQYLDLGSSVFEGVTRRLRLDRSTILQRLIDDQPNDGLVPESSSDLTRVLGGLDGRVEHRNDYLAYPRTNHTNLARNQEVAGIVVQWLIERAGLRPGRA